MVRVMEEMVIKKRKWKGSYYGKCFVAKDFVDWYCGQFDVCRDEAVRIGVLMQRKLRIFDHVARCKVFEDGNDLYRFEVCLVFWLIVDGFFCACVE